MKFLKKSFVMMTLLITTIGLSAFSNLSFADEGAEEAIKAAQSELPELKSGHYLSIDKSPTISFKKKNSEKILVTMEDGTGFKTIRYEYKEGNKDDNLADVARKKFKAT